MASFSRSVGRAMKRSLPSKGYAGTKASREVIARAAMDARGWGDIITYGAGCTWWDSGFKASQSSPFAGHSFPCCPHCGGLLFQVDSEKVFLAASAKYEADGHPGYVAMMLWARGKCFKSMADLAVAFETSVSAPGKADA